MDEISKLADAVLYEGYILWPYTRSALKNQKRWTFGGVYPPRHSEVHPDDPAALHAQCLVEAAAEPRFEVEVRFLHVVARDVLNAEGRRVDELETAGGRHLSWDEATERRFSTGLGRTPLVVEAGRAVEPLPAGAGEIVRSWRRLRGEVAASVDAVAERLYRLSVRVANETPWAGADREDALRQTFCSTHAVLRVENGTFVSPTDPPDELREAAAACENAGLWPVLVGAEGERHTLFASPIILSDYPQVAPESPGDLFDGGEIDRLLILNVLALSEAEQEEMRATDPRAREILDRCASLGPDQLLPLHGRLTGLGAEAE
jgi:hypothetical protein